LLLSSLIHIAPTMWIAWDRSPPAWSETRHPHRRYLPIYRSRQHHNDHTDDPRLTITVAHRLSTIRKADVIFVMEQGQVVEQGSHNELVELGGRYYELVQAQL
jgi:hypothetical protein